MRQHEMHALLVAVRSLIARRGLTLADAAREAKIPRQRLTDSLNGKQELTAAQWRRLYRKLGVYDGIIAAIVRVIDRA